MKEAGVQSQGRPSPLAAFDPQRLARLETEMWKAYYRVPPQRLRLLRLLISACAEQYGLSLWQSLVGAYWLTRATFLFKFHRNQSDLDRTRAYLERFFQMVRDAAQARFDYQRVAKLELNWWLVHRKNSGEPDQSPLINALAEECAALYDREVKSMLPTGSHRAQAMIIRDSMEHGKPSGSWSDVEVELLHSYTALKQELSSRQI
ncbi:MAG: hypothetical protein HYZ68_07510 [Chloroflexi bacterium]|nr:hypothetical protein [Chloroflexota bacterium]